MSNFVLEKVFLWRVLSHYFNAYKISAESHRVLLKIFDKYALAEKTYEKWFARFPMLILASKTKNELGGQKV